MPHLGHSARILVATQDVATSLAAWLAIGFTLLAADESLPPTFARLTDGQVIVTLMQTTVSSPTLAYFNSDPELLHKELQAGNLGSMPVSPSELKVTGPGGMEMFVHRQPETKALRPTREGNPVLGYFDGMIVPVKDVAQEKTMAEMMGFIVTEEHAQPFPRVDMTDGHMSISLQQTAVAGRPLVYDGDLDDDTIADLQERCGDRCEVFRSPEGQPLFIRIVMPEGTTVLVMSNE